MRDKATTVCGLHAALAVLRHRPHAIRRVYYTAAVRHELGALLKHTAALRRPYNEVGPGELETISGTVHHGGVAVVADPVELVALEPFLRALPRDAFVVALDGVGNPHNVGAILRTCAWFGAAGLIVPLDDPRQGTLSDAAVRVARGGAEVVPVVGVQNLAQALRDLAQAGVTRVAAEADTGTSPFDDPLPRPCCLVLGNEDEGLTPAVRVACDRRVSIPGTGAVESLNVSVAAGILLASLARHGVGAPAARTVLAPGRAVDGRSIPGERPQEPRGSRRRHRDRRRGGE